MTQAVFQIVDSFFKYNPFLFINIINEVFIKTVLTQTVEVGRV